ncbi:MAG: hypothetical protein OXG25_13930 [Gammaproteobacteria bacterium]|nr:hypothetical protein [Gammaproteobacteria bacterium]
MSQSTVLRRHWQKRGFENGFKGPLREMNLHHPPIASLADNQVYHLCGLIAQMLLTYLQYIMLPNDVQNVEPRPVIRDLMRSVAKLTCSDGRYCLLFSSDHRHREWLTAAMHRYKVWWASAPG